MSGEKIRPKIFGEQIGIKSNLQTSALKTYLNICEGTVMNFVLKVSLFCLFLGQVPDVMYQILDKPMSKDELQGRLDNIPQTLEDFMAEIKERKPDAKNFALKLREMVLSLVS